MRWTAAVFGLGVGLLLGCTAMHAADQPKNFQSPVEIDGTDAVVVPVSQFGRCESARNGLTFRDVPDAPPRMFRRSDGTLLMIAPNSGNVPFESNDGVHFSRSSCDSMLPSRIDPDPSKYADQDWVLGFYTANGKDVFALVHDEYHGVENIPTCQARLASHEAIAYKICQQIALTGYVSHDAGKSFQSLPFDMPLAAPPVTLKPDNYSTYGNSRVGDPSNIVRNPADGYYYLLGVVDKVGSQVAGTCTLRSKDPLMQPWFAWDGSGFASRMGSPYADKGQPCTPVRGPGIFTPTVTYNTVLRAFIAIGQSDDNELVAQISKDMVHWGDVIRLGPSVLPGHYSPMRGDPVPTQYFSIIDPQSTSRFFDTSGAHPYLYYVRFPVMLGQVQWHSREIWRVRLSVRNIAAAN
jgi:hypothetical protein